MHYLLEDAFVAGAGRQDRLSYTFLRGLENRLAFDTNPLYALLHEPLYCQDASSARIPLAEITSWNRWGQTRDSSAATPE